MHHGTGQAATGRRASPVTVLSDSESPADARPHPMLKFLRARPDSESEAVVLGLRLVSPSRRLQVLRSASSRYLKSARLG
jgi:hypothetical protein